MRVRTNHTKSCLTLSMSSNPVSVSSAERRKERRIESKEGVGERETAMKTWYPSEGLNYMTSNGLAQTADSTRGAQVQIPAP